MSGKGARVALVVVSLVAAGAGWFGASQFGGDATPGTALAAVDLYECPADGSRSVGQVHAGDEVWLIGVSDDRWAVIRNPGDPDRPAWLPLALVDTDASAGDLPQLTCGQAVTTATTTAAATAATTTPASTSSPVVLASSTSSSSSTSTSSTTIAADTVPPTVTVTTDRAYLYVRSEIAPCSSEDSLEVSIVVADPTVPLSIRSIVATWDAPGGPQTANLVPVGGNRFSLEVAANGPATGETPLTLTATGSDGAGNVGTGQTIVLLRDPGSFECPG